MNRETVVLIAALIAALTSVITLLINSKLLIKKEQRMELWNKELDRFFKLEEDAGLLKEVAFSGIKPHEVSDWYSPISRELIYSAGKFSRYPKVAQAIREFNLICSSTVANQIDVDERQDIKNIIEKRYQELLSECDVAVGRNT